MPTISKEDPYDNNTLARIETGLTLNFDNNFSAYGFCTYSAGENYKSLGVGLGMRYSW